MKRPNVITRNSHISYLFFLIHIPKCAENNSKKFSEWKLVSMTFANKVIQKKVFLKKTILLVVLLWPSLDHYMLSFLLLFVSIRELCPVVFPKIYFCDLNGDKCFFNRYLSGMIPPLGINFQISICQLVDWWNEICFLF